MTLFFASRRPGGSGSLDIWVTTRETTEDDWSAPVNLGPTVNSSAEEIFPEISADGLQLYFSEYTVFRPGGYGGSDMWVTTHDTASDPWGTPVNLGPVVNSSAHDDGPSITADGLALFFSSTRPGGHGSVDLWVTTRDTIDDEWGTPINLRPTVNTSAAESGPAISADGSTLYFYSNRPGGFGERDLWEVPILPFVDFNGDEIVDIDDLVILIEHWGQDDPSVDIGPMPWGDGVVDEADLEVLMSYWQQEILPVELVAYWKLDETEGSIAHDSAGVYDGLLNGVPIWQPSGGKVDGALEFDGIDDYLSADFMLDRANAKFSVFAWVKGGMPGQVVFSQAGLSDWLGADTTNGSLMTELKFLGKASRVLLPQTVITYGEWHRIGLVWDGSNRILYVDDVQVAADAYDKGLLMGGLQIGAGKNRDPGTFFSGLIDDVRIYDRAITP